MSRSVAPSTSLPRLATGATRSAVGAEDAENSAAIIKPLHGLRAIAALTVLVGHLLPEGLAPSLGVVLFFLLSGFLMGKLYLAKPFARAAVTRYAAARFGRIYPLFAIVVVLAVAMPTLGLPSPFRLAAGDLVPHLLLAGAGLTIWTISVECQFYALFLPLWYALGRVARPALWCGLGFAVSALLAIWIQPFAGRIDLARYQHLFIGGVFLALIVRNWDPTRLAFLARLVLPLAMLAYAIAFVLVESFYFQGLVYGDPVIIAICLILLASAACAREGPFVVMLSSRPMIWLGELSFGIYLIHRFPQSLVREYLPGAGVVQSFVLVTALTLLLAWLAHAWIERPAGAAIRKAGARIA